MQVYIYIYRNETKMNVSKSQANTRHLRKKKYIAFDQKSNVIFFSTFEFKESNLKNKRGRYLEIVYVFLKLFI